MTVARRLTKLESSLSPKEAVFHWLDEAHAFPTALAYLSWLLTQPRDTYPLIGIPKRVEQAARQATRGHRDADRTVRDAVSDAVFLAHLALGVVTTIEEALRVEGLRAAALMWWMRALSTTVPDGDRLPHGLAGWTSWHEVAALHIIELRTVDAVTRSIADRYLDGRDCLFHDSRTGWVALRERAEQMQGIGWDVAALSGHERDEAEPHLTPLDEDISRRSSMLVAHARAQALEHVGRNEASLSAAELELRLLLDVA